MNRKDIAKGSVKTLQINQPIDSKQFTVPFPANTLVLDISVGKRNFCIWGDGKPKKYFDTEIEVQEYIRGLRIKQNAGTPVIPTSLNLSEPDYTFYYVIAAAILLLFLTGIYYWRLRRNR